MKDDKNAFALDIPSNKVSKSKERPARKLPSEAKETEREFVAGASTHTVFVPTGSNDLPDWRSLDPLERPTRGINVRFNDYELAMLRHLSKVEDRSIHQTIKRYLVPTIREALGEK